MLLPTLIVTSTKSNQGLELLSILGHELECKKVWETRVLLPTFLNCKEICFACPYRPELNYESIESWFPIYEEGCPIIHKEAIRSDFLKQKSGIFRASPPKDRKTFFNSLARLQHGPSSSFRRRLCLGKFLLAIEIMDTPGKMKPIPRPLWIVQLFFNVILASHITPERDVPTHIKLKIEGARLTYLTPTKEFWTYECYTRTQGSGVKSTTSKPPKTNVSKGFDDSNADVPISSSLKATSSATTKQQADKIMDLSSSQDPSQTDIPVSIVDVHTIGEARDPKGQDAQSHGVSSPSEAMSIPKPIIEENAIEVDLILDQLLDIETEQNSPAAEEQVRVKVLTDTYTFILVVETNAPVIEQNIVEKSPMEIGEDLQRETHPLDIDPFSFIDV
ncbi:hypothetical protein JHK87_039613 [Glycine soja]|nr:hypothetical protein JHK87_039613 [Glycine soja]